MMDQPVTEVLRMIERGLRSDSDLEEAKQEAEFMRAGTIAAMIINTAPRKNKKTYTWKDIFRPRKKKASLDEAVTSSGIKPKNVTIPYEEYEELKRARNK